MEPNSLDCHITSLLLNSFTESNEFGAYTSCFSLVKSMTCVIRSRIFLGRKEILSPVEVTHRRLH